MFEKLKEWVRKMISKNNVKRALGVDTVISTQMEAAIILWSKLYEGRPPWLCENVKSLNLPSAIAGELARAVTIEMKASVSGSGRADFINAQLIPVLNDIRRYTEYACAKGALIFKPYIDGDKITVDYIQADSFFPTAFDSSGRISGAVFADRKIQNDKFYTRLEYHCMTENGCRIVNSAFVSDSALDLGKEVPLGEVYEWADLEKEVLIKGIKHPLFAYFKTPFANTTDTLSPLGVSVYSRAVDLIEQADRQYSRLLWEFESGERALFVNESAFKKDDDGKPILPDIRLYRALGFDDDNMFKDWTPTLREKNILNGLDNILMKIEDVCGLARGTVSNPQTEAKTATELKIMRQRSYATVADTQKSLRYTLEDLIYAIDVWTSLGRLAPSGSFEAAFEFDDSIAADRQTEFSEKQQLVSNGIMQKWEFRMWYFGETEEQAKKAVFTQGENSGE